MSPSTTGTGVLCSAPAERSGDGAFRGVENDLGFTNDVSLRGIELFYVLLNMKDA
jgi:hypothetical protein